MTAGLATVGYLERHATTLYPVLENHGRIVREGVDKAFAECGVRTHTTGLGSLFQTHFGAYPRSAEEVAAEDIRRTRDYALFLMAAGIFVLPGHLGGVSSSHTSIDIRTLIELSAKFAASKNRAGK